MPNSSSKTPAHSKSLGNKPLRMKRNGSKPELLAKLAKQLGAPSEPALPLPKDLFGDNNWVLSDVQQNGQDGITNDPYLISNDSVLLTPTNTVNTASPMTAQPQPPMGSIVTSDLFKFINEQAENSSAAKNKRQEWENFKKLIDQRYLEESLADIKEALERNLSLAYEYNIYWQCKRPLLFYVLEKFNPKIPFTLEICELFLNCLGEVKKDIRDGDGNTAWHVAIEVTQNLTLAGHEEIFALLKNYPWLNINSINNKGYTALEQAAKPFRGYVCELLIKNGAQIYNPNSQPPIFSLHKAAAEFDIKAFALLASKADINAINAVNEAGKTPVDLAPKKHQQKIQDILIENGGNPPALKPSKRKTIYTPYRSRKKIMSPTDSNVIEKPQF